MLQPLVGFNGETEQELRQQEALDLARELGLRGEVLPFLKALPIAKFGTVSLDLPHFHQVGPFNQTYSSGVPHDLDFPPFTLFFFNWDGTEGVYNTMPFYRDFLSDLVSGEYYPMETYFGWVDQTNINIAANLNILNGWTSDGWGWTAQCTYFAFNVPVNRVLI